MPIPPLPPSPRPDPDLNRIQKTLLHSAKVCDESRTALLVYGYVDTQLIDELRAIAGKLKVAAASVGN